MTSNACFGSSSVARTSIGLRDGSSPTPIARAIAGMTRSVSATLPSGTNQAPSGYSSARLAATWSARRVLPVPPGPVSVTSRVLARSARISSSSRSRPTNDDSSIGRLLGRASSERIGGKSAGRPSITSCAIRSGRRSLSRWAPSDLRDRPGPRWPSTSDAVASESSTWPPWPAAPTRAARWTSWPTYAPSASSSPSPVWRPIRTRIAPPSGHGSACSARCMSATAAVAAAASAKTAKNPSPSTWFSIPPWATSASRTIVRWRASNGRHAAVPSVDTSRVEPSMSVNRNVTSPVGRSGAATVSSGVVVRSGGPPSPREGGRRPPSARRGRRPVLRAARARSPTTRGRGSASAPRR